MNFTMRKLINILFLVIIVFLSCYAVITRIQPKICIGEQYVLGFDSLDTIYISTFSISKSQIVEYQISTGEKNEAVCFIDKAQILFNKNGEWFCIKEKENSLPITYTPILYDEQQSPSISDSQTKPNTTYSEFINVNSRYGRLKKGTYRLVVPVRISGKYYDIFYEFFVD